MGSWVCSQRSNKKVLAPEQLKRLNSLGFVWDALAERWEQNFSALQKFHKREGHCVVPRGHMENELNLSLWVCVQRRVKKGLTPDQLKRLNSLGFVWDALAERWDQIFALLQKFQKREGHCRAPSGHEEDGVNLGKWAGYQRANKAELTPNQLRRLNSLGFSWDPIAEDWEQNFAALEKFHEREGHCRVPKNHIEDGQNLARWVQRQRGNRERLTRDQLNRLNALGFVWTP